MSHNENKHEKKKRGSFSLVFGALFLTLFVTGLVFLLVAGLAYEIRNPFSFMPNSHEWVPALDNEGAPVWVLTSIFTLPALIAGLVAIRFRSYGLACILLALVPLAALVWGVVFFTLSTTKMDIYDPQSLTDEERRRAEKFYQTLDFHPVWETDFNGRTYIFYQWEREKE